jgi:hypothetical protein
MPWRLISYPRLKRIWEEWAKFGFVRDEKGLQQIIDVMESNTIKLSVITMLTGHTPENPDEYYEDAWGEYVEKVIKQYYRDEAKKDERHHSKDPDQLEFNWGKEDGKRKEVEVDRIDNPFLVDILDGIEIKLISFEELKKHLMDKLQRQFFYYYIEDPESGQMRISDYGLKPLVDLTSELRETHNTSRKVVIIDKMLNVVHQRSDLASWYVRGGSNALADLSASPSERENEK